jgi:hypothetical protein
MLVYITDKGLLKATLRYSPNTAPAPIEAGSIVLRCCHKNSGETLPPTTDLTFYRSGTATMNASIYRQFKLPTKKKAGPTRLEVSVGIETQGRGLGGTSKELDVYISST